MSGCSSGAIHHTAAEGYAVGAKVKGRPEYPSALTYWLHDEVRVRPGTTVVELGAGTGKFTRLLLPLQARVIAVEPVPEMLARLAADIPGATAMPGTATAIPLPDGSVDVVVCVQAFHWFATKEALEQISRVLKPGGRLALVWNLRDAQVPWVAKMDAIADAHEGDVPRFYKGTWRKAFPQAGFETLEESQFENAHTGAADDVIVNRVLSTSFISALPQEQHQQVERELRALIAGEPELRNVAVVSVPYRTFAFCATKAP